MAQKEKKEKKHDTMPIIEGGEELTNPTETEEQQPQVARVIDASGVEKPQHAHEDCAEMEGQTVKTEQGPVTFKEVVTGHLDGEEIRKVVPTRDSTENTLTVGEDVNLYNDWNDREFIIERIEGIHEKNADGKSVRVAPGFLDIAEDYAWRRIHDIDLPDHAGLKQWMHEYQVQVKREARFKVPIDIDIKAGVRFYFEASLDHIKARKVKLNSEQLLGVLSVQEYQNTRMLLELAEGAYRKYLAGEIVV